MKKGLLEKSLMELAILMSQEMPNNRINLSKLLKLLCSSCDWQALIATDQKDQLIGGCIFRQHEYEEECLVELLAIVVKEDCREFGIGKALLSKLKESYSYIGAIVDY